MKQDNAGIPGGTYRNALFAAIVMLIISCLVLAWAVAGARSEARKAAEQAVIAVENSEDNADEFRQQILDVALQIKSCVEPEGKCARRGQRATAEAVGGINVNTLLTVVCGFDLQDPALTRNQLETLVVECVEDELASP